MVTTAQQRLGFQLPLEYLTLLCLQNGGNTHEFGYSVESAPPIALRELCGIVVDPQIESAQNILDTPYLTREWGLPAGLVLLAGDGHEWIALDYRRGSPPGITWFDQVNALELSLAASFADFIAGLRPLAELVSEDGTGLQDP